MESPPDLDRKALDELFHEVGSYRNCNDFHELYQFIKKFPGIAPYNALLLHIQRPGSNYVATIPEWKKLFNRTVKPGARPLVILQAFGPVRFVFDLEDTEGDEFFPERLRNPFQTEGSIEANKFHFLMKNLKRDGISYHESDHGTNSAGYIQWRPGPFFRNSKHQFIGFIFNLIVNMNHSKEEKLATIAHELGHLYCGHLGTPERKWWPDRCSVTDKVSREFEAESVAWLVCERAGIKNPSAQYLSGYLSNNQQIPHISIETVLKAAGMIEAMMERTLPARKELIA